MDTVDVDDGVTPGEVDHAVPADDTSLFDLDGDGYGDLTAIDTDADGVLDLGWTDHDGDGVVDADERHPVDGGGPDGEWATDWDRRPENFAHGALPSDASPARFSADQGPGENPDMHGDPEQASSYWYAQGVNGYCVPASVAQIVGEWQGVNVGEQEVVGRAVAHGWLTQSDTDGDGTVDDASGMTSSEAEALLESYGIPATTTHGSLKDLEFLLDQNRDIIAYIDADELWTGRDDDGTDGGGDANHAVVVTGIDAENVYLSDPGDPTGAIEVVPRAVFEDAWSDSGHEMLVTDTAPPASEPASNAPEYAIPAEGAAATPTNAPPVDPSIAGDAGGKPGGPALGASQEDASPAPSLLSASSSGVVLLPIVLRDVAVATLPVSAALVAGGVVRRRRARTRTYAE